MVCATFSAASSEPSARKLPAIWRKSWVAGFLPPANAAPILSKPIFSSAVDTTALVAPKVKACRLVNPRLAASAYPPEPPIRPMYAVPAPGRYAFATNAGAMSAIAYPACPNVCNTGLSVCFKEACLADSSARSCACPLVLGSAILLPSWPREANASAVILPVVKGRVMRVESPARVGFSSMDCSIKFCRFAAKVWLISLEIPCLYALAFSGSEYI